MAHIHVVATVKPTHLTPEELGPLPRSLVFQEPNAALRAAAPPAAPPAAAPADVDVPVGPATTDDPTKGSQFQPDVDAGYKTVYVIGLDDADKAAIAGTAQNVLDYLSYLTGIANGKVADAVSGKKIASDDYALQSDYRSRVMNALFLQTQGFLAIEADAGFSHKLTSKAAELHTEILQLLFKGLPVPTQILGMFETMFSQLKDSILKISASSTVDNKHLFLIVKSFIKNDLGIVDTKIRIFLFKMSNQVKQVTVAKNSFTSVDLELDFENVQYQWNDKVYQGVKDDMDKKLVDDGKKTLADLPNIDVPV